VFGVEIDPEVHVRVSTGMARGFAARERHLCRRTSSILKPASLALLMRLSAILLSSVTSDSRAMPAAKPSLVPRGPVCLCRAFPVRGLRFSSTALKCSNPAAASPWSCRLR
jgi:hypothetical protein